MKTLKEYLTNLRNSESDWLLYINPNNINQYCIQEKNLTQPKNMVCMGTLESLSPYRKYREREKPRLLRRGESSESYTLFMKI